MKKVGCIVIASFVAILFSCKDKAAESEAVGKASYESSESAVDAAANESLTASKTNNEMTSAAAVVDKNSKRKFLKSVDGRFEVENVVKSTYFIENLATKMGGFVTKSNLTSEITATQESKISMDSTLILSKYRVVNEIAIKVPNIRLDSLLRSLSKVALFIDHRTISNEDVTLQYLSHELTQKRGKKHQSRVEKAIATKSGGVDKVVGAENDLHNAEENSDTELTNHLNLDDNVNFSTVTLSLYQKEKLKKEVVVSVDSIRKMEPNFFYKIWEGIKYGWFLIENITIWIITIWPILLFLCIGFFFLKKKRALKS
jgi:hypothetical protein